MDQPIALQPADGIDRFHHAVQRSPDLIHRPQATVSITVKQYRKDSPVTAVIVTGPCFLITRAGCAVSRLALKVSPYAGTSVVTRQYGGRVYLVTSRLRRCRQDARPQRALVQKAAQSRHSSGSYECLRHARAHTKDIVTGAFTRGGSRGAWISLPRSGSRTHQRSQGARPVR